MNKLVEEKSWQEFIEQPKTKKHRGVTLLAILLPVLPIIIICLLLMT
jgi:hypothetical protein